MPYGRLAASVTLDRYEAHHVLDRLHTFEGPLLRGLHDKVFKAWQLRGAQQWVTVPLTKRELEVMRRLGASSSPQVIRYKWFAIYTNGTSEVYTQTTQRPPKKKTLRVPGRGRKKFDLHRLYKLPLDSKESAEFMARKKAAVKDPDEIDELEGLEELEDEEPDVEEEDDDEEEAKPKRRRRSTAKKAAPKRTRRKKAVVEEEDDEEEDEEEEDDDDEEEEAPKRRTRSKSSVKTAKSNGKGSKKGAKSAAGRTTKEMTGGVGTSELAEAASDIADADIDGRDVRVFLRKNEVEKNEEHGRYYWKSTNSPQFKKLAKQIAAEYGDE